MTLIWSGNPSLPLRTFTSLRDADAAFARAYTSGSPLTDRSFDETGFRVTWTDGKTHDGVAYVNAGVVEASPGRGGILRGHLEDVAHWLGSERHARSWHHRYGDRYPGGLVERREWGRELLRRLRADEELVVSAAPRNIAATSYGGGGIPTLAASSRASAWLDAAPSPPTLLPDPQMSYHAVYRLFRESFPDRVIDWTDPRANAFLNYLTLALRNDLPRLDAGDAAVIWKRWRDALLGFRAHRTEEGHGDIAHRSLTITRQLVYALRRPGSVFESFCPWRSLYFDQDALEPSADRKARRSRWEVDSWRA